MVAAVAAVAVATRRASSTSSEKLLDYIELVVDLFTINSF